MPNTTLTEFLRKKGQNTQMIIKETGDTFFGIHFRSDQQTAVEFIENSKAICFLLLKQTAPAAYRIYSFFVRGENIILFHLYANSRILVASAYAGDILDLIEDCGKYEAKRNSSHNSNWNS